MVGAPRVYRGRRLTLAAEAVVVAAAVVAPSMEVVAGSEAAAASTEAAAFEAAGFHGGGGFGAAASTEAAAFQANSGHFDGGHFGHHRDRGLRPWLRLRRLRRLLQSVLSDLKTRGTVTIRIE